MTRGACVRAHSRIQPTHGWAALNLGEVWAFRDLLWILARRDVKLRYAQTALGIAWVVLQPLVASLIFALIFGRLANLPSNGRPYLVFVFAGMIPWTLFGGAVQRAGNSLVSEAQLLNKVYFPRMIVPISGALAVVLDAAIAVAVLAILLVVYAAAPSWTLLTAPFFLLLALVSAVGVSLLLSALSVQYRDFVHAIPFLLQVWMYASPLVYSIDLVPPQWQALYSLNPMVGVIEGFRWAVFGGGTFPALPILIGAVVAVAQLVAGALVFRRVERTFADVA
jgi:lipopolysaccharide transport system permease protein